MPRKQYRHVADTDVIRVSFSALLRIRDDHCYLLFHSSARPGSFGPPGGAFKYFEPATPILDRLHFRAERVGSREEIMRGDVRGFLPARKLAGFSRWFDSGAYREDGEECLRRELIEELGEVGLPHSASAVGGMRFSLVREVREGPRPVPGKPYRQVRRFNVYDLVSASESTVRLREDLVDAGRDPEVDTVLWATVEEIVHGRCGNALIAPQSAFLVDGVRIHPDLPALL